MCIRANITGKDTPNRHASLIGENAFSACSRVMHFIAKLGIRLHLRMIIIVDQNKNVAYVIVFVIIKVFAQKASKLI